MGNLSASSGIIIAKNEAREQAGTLGAHIVLLSVVRGYSPSVSGNAYNFTQQAVFESWGHSIFNEWNK